MKRDLKTRSKTTGILKACQPRRILQRYLKCGQEEVKKKIFKKNLKLQKVK